MNCISGGRVQPASVPIAFIDSDLETFMLPHSNQLVIKLRIRDAMVSRVLVDGGSSSNIIFWEVFRRMSINQDLISPANTPIHAFNGADVNQTGTISLLVYVAD